MILGLKEFVNIKNKGKYGENHNQMMSFFCFFFVFTRDGKI